MCISLSEALLDVWSRPFLISPYPFEDYHRAALLYYTFRIAMLADSCKNSASTTGDDIIYWFYF